VTPTAFDQPGVGVLVAHLEATAIALIAALLIWRIELAGVDRFVARRFVKRLIPRVATFSSLTKSVGGFLIFCALVLLILNIWEVDVIPAVWSAGIITAALAFGAQWIVKDVIAGLSVLFEDQFDVGDDVELLTGTNAVVTGTIESVGLRSTRVVDGRGRLIMLPNGNIQMVTNASRLPTRAAFTLELPWRADAASMRQRVESYARAAAADIGIPPTSVTASLQDASIDRGAFRVEISASSAGDQVGGRGVMERLVSRLQEDGWLPSGAAAAPSDHEDTH
jgi:small conductance mechanosensitive channel